ncbi:hypothetical protein Ahy_B01g056410 [Arachis hypogaea]|uniref:Aminotransferase-like plant mobile domain-containing protein n=1 Tax=Arachis hypogaea TaxID=3818 RepID=A0A445AYR9_ARAHY|nr:hypothetical protein Ahy_B01g056410 [Arachis hypogaea]
MEEGNSSWEWFQELFGELPPQNNVTQYTVHFTWFHERFRVLPDDPTEDTVRIYARAYIMILLSTQLFSDKSGNRVHIQWLPFVARLDDISSYSWGRQRWLGYIVANRNVTNLAGPKQLLQSWIFRQFPSLRLRGFDTYSFPLTPRWATYLSTSDRKEERIVWEPYASLDMMAVVHPEILTEEHSRLWHACTCLIYFAVIEWHQVDRVLPQLGSVQHKPKSASNIDWLHAKDGRGGDRWFPSYYQNRVDFVLSIPRVSDPGPSADFLRWWYRVAHRFLSPNFLIADPREEEISQDVVQKGSSQAPSRVSMPDVPDNRCVERRRRIATWATDREWRWLDEMIQDDTAGGDGVGHVDHRVWRGRPQRRGGASGVASGGPGDRPTEQAGTRSQEVPFTHVSSSRRYHEIHGQMYDDLAGPTFTMDRDDQVGSSQFYSDFTDLIRDDDPPHFQHQTPQDRVPESQPQMDVV